MASIGIFAFPIIPFIIPGLTWSGSSVADKTRIVSVCLSAIEDIISQIDFICIDVRLNSELTTPDDRSEYVAYVNSIVKLTKDWLRINGLVKDVYGITSREIRGSSTQISISDFVDSININEDFVDGFIYYSHAIEYWTRLFDLNQSNDQTSVDSLSELIGSNITGANSESFTAISTYNNKNLFFIDEAVVNDCSIYSSTLFIRCIPI